MLELLHFNQFVSHCFWKHQHNNQKLFQEFLPSAWRFDSCTQVAWLNWTQSIFWDAFSKCIHKTNKSAIEIFSATLSLNWFQFIGSFIEFDENYGELFYGMVDRQKMLIFVFRWGHYQIFSSLQISDLLSTGFELRQKRKYELPLWGS